MDRMIGITVSDAAFNETACINGKDGAPMDSVKNKRIPGVRVLVVDDNEISRDIAQWLLESDGAAVSMVGDGQAALDWVGLHRHAVDIVLMDLQMPVMDGHEATRKLRGLAPGLPVIALTADTTQQEAAQDAGVSAFVAKPIKVEELIATILRLTPGSAYDGAQAHGAGAPTAQGGDTLQPGLPPGGVPGIAMQHGMSVWNDLAVYRKFLKRFAVDYADCMTHLMHSIAGGDHATARALAHKLKGAAGNLALHDVARFAAALEAIKPTGCYRTALDQLQTALQTAFASIKLFAHVEQVMPLTNGADRQQAAPLLAELLATLDTDAPDRANELMDVLTPMLLPDALNSIQDRVDAFDFRGAESLVHSLAGNLKIDLGK